MFVGVDGRGNEQRHAGRRRRWGAGAYRGLSDSIVSDNIMSLACPHLYLLIFVQKAVACPGAVDYKFVRFVTGLSPPAPWGLGRSAGARAGLAARLRPLFLFLSALAVDSPLATHD